MEKKKEGKKNAIVRLREPDSFVEKERGVRLLGRSIRARKNPWEARRLTPPSTFQGSQSFLLSLSGEKKERFQELLLLGLLEALATTRYFCLQGEQYTSFKEIAKRYGFTHPSAAHDKIKAVLLYLDSKSVASASEATKRLAKSIKNRVMRLREKGIALKEILGSPLVRTPAGMPLTPMYVQKFKHVLARNLEGKLLRMKQKRPSDYKVLTLRFGLEDGRYRTLEEVGQEMGGITRERVRQLEQRALECLKISSPPKH